MTAFVAPVVEGQTEQLSVERLLHRVWHEQVHNPFRLQVLPASRGKRDRLAEGLRPDLPTKVEEACVKLGSNLADPSARCLVLLLLDAEDACPAELAPSLLAAAQAVRTDVPVSCVLARRMFENWLLAGAATLAGVNGLPDALPAVPDCEGPHGANWLGARLREGSPTRKYKKSVDAPEFVRRFDVTACRQLSPSFAKLCRELGRLVPPPTAE
jgi:hypothetical protein